MRSARTQSAFRSPLLPEGEPLRLLCHIRALNVNRVMLAVRDSATPPTPRQVAQAQMAGIAGWGGYLSTKSSVGLEHPWSWADFDVVRILPMQPIAYASGNDDPFACKQLAKQWKVRLCLDVEESIRGDGAWVPGWLDASGAGLYGNYTVHPGRSAAFHIMSGYPGHDPGSTWPADQPRPNTLCGWQWQGSHDEFGLGVDSNWFDDGFLTGGEDVPTQVEWDAFKNDFYGFVARLAYYMEGNFEFPSVQIRDAWATDAAHKGPETYIFTARDSAPGRAEFNLTHGTKSLIADLESRVAKLENSSPQSSGG